MPIRNSITTLTAVILALILSACAGKQQAIQTENYARLGTVNFPISCAPDSRQQFEDALALLHHMMYKQAEAQFNELTRQDPNCSMAWWGVAMTQFQPLWPGQPSAAALKKGLDALNTAKASNPLSAMETDFINATLDFFQHTESKTHQQRLATWLLAQQQLHKKYPQQSEAAVLYALAQLANASKSDPNYRAQQQAGKLLEQLYKKNPQHPGVQHYTIHAYDNSLLAEHGVTAAKAYDKLAPEVPHALHMPTHIFVRLGHWDKVIALNNRSAQAALKFPVNGRISHHNPHSRDYQVYAYLQLSQDDAALHLIQQLGPALNYQNSFVSAYALAAMPARYQLERRQWQTAANIDEQLISDLANFPHAQAILVYAQGLGAARSQDLNKATLAIKKLDTLYQLVQEKGHQYWLLHIDVYRKTIAAWIAYAQQNSKLAVALMTQAADLEDSVNKHPVTPGAILPARELLADMLRLYGQYENALVTYERSLSHAAARFNSYYGAALAAELSGKHGLAKEYYRKLRQLTGGISNPTETQAANTYSEASM